MNVLITGGAGFIGLHLARYHAKRNDSVTILDNLFKTDGTVDPELQEFQKNRQVRLFSVDLTRPLELERPAAVDIVYHLAAINGTRLFYEIPYQLARNNLLITINLLDWLEGVRIGRLLYSSTSEVYAGGMEVGVITVPTDETVPVVFPQPTATRFSYGTTKFMGEFLCSQFGKHAGVPTSIVRYHNIYGPRMGTRHVIPEFFLRLQALENPFLIYGGSETRAFCYVDDAVEATHIVAINPECIGEIIHIGNSKEEIEIEKLAVMMMDLTGERFPIREQGRRIASVARRCPNTDKLRRLTGFEAQVGLREGLQRTMEWCRAHLSFNASTLAR
jgi:nucleoside-diphosphate-sugar epimerase